MGIFREIDGKRRQSAPPLNSYDPNANRQEYLEKIKKFNQFRQKQQLPPGPKAYNTTNINEYANNTSVKQLNNLESNCIVAGDHTTTITSKEYDSMDHWKCDQMYNDDIDYHHIIDQNHDHCTSFNVDEINNDALQPLNNVIRQSLPPFMSRSYITKSLRRNANKTKPKCNPQQINNTTILNAKEIEEFEEHYCNHNNNNNSSSMKAGHTLQMNNGCVNSPPENFFRENSKPYPLNNGNSITQSDDRYAATPIKPPRKTDEKRQRSCPSMAASNRASKTSDEGIDTKTGSRRISPPYETIINRHGDRVEYALPYSSDPGSDECEHKLLPKAKRKNVISSEKKSSEMSPDQRKCEEIVQESYNFLDNIDTDDNGDSGVSFFAGQQRSNVIVTDLDKSLDSNRTLDRNTLASSKCGEGNPNRIQHFQYFFFISRGEFRKG